MLLTIIRLSDIMLTSPLHYRMIPLPTQNNESQSSVQIDLQSPKVTYSVLDKETYSHGIMHTCTEETVDQ